MIYIKTSPLTIAGTIKPSDDYIPYEGEIPEVKYLKWDNVTQSIVEDINKKQLILDDMIILSKLDIFEALDSLPEERVKFDILMQNEKFKERWNATIELDMEHPLTIEALALVDFNVDEVKQMILDKN